MWGATYISYPFQKTLLVQPMFKNFVGNCRSFWRSFNNMKFAWKGTFEALMVKFGGKIGTLYQIFTPALRAARPSGRNRGARIQSGGYILRCPQLLTSCLRRSARISPVLETAWKRAHSWLQFFVTNRGSQLTIRTQLEKEHIFCHTFCHWWGSQQTFMTKLEKVLNFRYNFLSLWGSQLTLMTQLEKVLIFRHWRRSQLTF